MLSGRYYCQAILDKVSRPCTRVYCISAGGWSSVWLSVWLAGCLSGWLSDPLSLEAWRAEMWIKHVRRGASQGVSSSRAWS